MGRGRAKAKQQKVARELKYHTGSTDFGALQRELGTSSSGAKRVNGEVQADEDEDDEYDDWTGTER